MNDFHCCATCRHIKVEKKSERIKYYCSRLGYETKTTYKFNCWSPKDHVIRLMNKKNTPKNDK
nr:hypothetical protein [Neobacillus vireti]